MHDKLQHLEIKHRMYMQACCSLFVEGKQCTQKLIIETICKILMVCTKFSLHQYSAIQSSLFKFRIFSSYIYNQIDRWIDIDIDKLILQHYMFTYIYFDLFFSKIRCNLLFGLKGHFGLLKDVSIAFFFLLTKSRNLLISGVTKKRHSVSQCSPYQFCNFDFLVSSDLFFSFPP